MSAFLTIAVIHFLAVISPGPDFAITVRNALKYSRRVGVYTSLGIALGLLVHVGYSLLGIGLIISQSILLYSIIKYIGAAYLIYIGWKALTSKGHMAPDDIHVRKVAKEISFSQSFRMGFLCNVLNPKVTIFMLSLFTQVIDPSTPFIVQLIYGLYMSIATFVWFSFVSLVLSQKQIKQLFTSIQTGIERLMGTVLMALGIRVAFASNE